MLEIAFAILLITLLIALALEESAHVPSAPDEEERPPEWW